MLYDEILKLRQKRAKAVADGRALYEEAKKVGRELDGEEKEKVSRAAADAEAFQKEIETLERLDAQERAVLAAAGNTQPVDDKKGNQSKAERKDALQDKALRALILDGNPKAQMTSEEVVEARALQVDVDSAGGYTRPGEKFLAMLLKNVDDLVAMRPFATKYQVADSESLGVPYLSARASNPTWTSELLTGSDDSQMAFGKRSLQPLPLAKRIKVSEKLLRSSALPVESIVAAELAYVFAIAEESAFMQGTGSGQPLGIFTASANGINTDRDVSTGNSTTSILIDGLKSAKWTLKSQYHGKAKWFFHRDAMQQIDKLKDGNGNYYWQPSIVPGQPDRLLGHDIVVSDYVPNTFTTGLYVGMFCDPSYYWIADALSLRVQRLNELYAETGQIGFIGRLECDGLPVLPEAFVRVKLA